MTDRFLPLCVDLDGTLIRSDLLFETLFACLRRRPWLLPLLLARLVGAALGGQRAKARFKAWLADQAGDAIAVDTLPYREDLLGYLRAERAAGRVLDLASASDERLVRRVADHLGLFDHADGSNPERNLRGTEKAALLLDRYPGGFAYAGDSSADLPVWAAASTAVVAGAPASVIGRIDTPIGARFENPPITGAVLCRAIRIKQWAKNGLIFIPLLLTAGYFDPALVAMTAFGFLAFSLLASATYILNDLFDLRLDRAHPSKRERPIAAGTIPIGAAVKVKLVLILSAAVIAGWLGPAFAACLLFYTALTLAYSVRLKSVPWADVTMLGLLFTVRLFTGNTLIGGETPYGLLTFSLVFFTSLALVKRLTEVQQVAAKGEERIQGRGYRAADLGLIKVLGPLGGVLSIAVFMLHLSVDSGHLDKLEDASWLWLVPGALALWLIRVWRLGFQARMNDDPVEFAVRDWPSRILGTVVFAAVVLAA